MSHAKLKAQKIQGYAVQQAMAGND